MSATDSTTPPGAVLSVGPGGRPVRTYRIGISAEALALAWARQEGAPAGATVVVEQEVSPRGRTGRLWPVAPERSLTLAVVLRPSLAADHADATWLAAGLAALNGCRLASELDLGLAWPESVVDRITGSSVAMVKVETQLGPGQVRSAVATVRLDLAQLGVIDRRRDVFVAVLDALDVTCVDLDSDLDGLAALYSARCVDVGRQVKVTLLPKGETRGTVGGIDAAGRLRLESATGMVERIGIDQIRVLEATSRG